MSGALAPLKTITHNLPPFVREPLIALLGNECYTTLIYNVDLDSTHCLKYALSKGLGLGIIAGGCIVKLPQIIKIVRSHSARGLSLSSYLLDTASLLITVAYNLRLKFPFSTYGENIALTLQNVVITLLIFVFSPSALTSGNKGSLSTARRSSPYPVAIAFILALVGSSYALLNDHLVPMSLLRSFVALSIPLALSAKVPQILANFRNGSTGQLSAFLVLNSLAGCLARTFTTATETGDSTLWWGFASAAALNAVLAAQLAYYWKSPGSEPTTTTPQKLKVEPVQHREKVPHLQGVGPAPAGSTSVNIGNRSPSLAARPATPPAGPRVSGQWQRKAV